MLRFEEVFGFEFGKKTKTKRYPDRATSDFLMQFTTPNNSEEDVRFSLDLMIMLMGEITMTVMSELGEVMFSKIFNANNRGALTMFVNKTGIDPKAGDPSGHPGIPSRPARNTWLKPNKTYTLHVHRDTHSDKQPIGIIYSGNDDNQIDYGIVTGDDEVEVSIAGVQGIWIPID